MTQQDTPPTIAFSEPYLAPAAEHYVLDVLHRGVTSGDGPYTARCRTFLEEACGCAAVLLTPSCTSALELAMMALELAPGDEVIMPSFTFVSTANAVVLQGATPVFVDVDPQTLNIDPDQVEAALSPRTRAIMPVHYAGVGCDMARLMAIAEAHELALVEDAAQGLGAFYQGKPLGSFGRFSAFSFHGTKNIGCGEGGALLATSDADVVMLETMREKGTDRSRFLRGEVDKYTWQSKGSSYLPSEFQAAVLLSQLEAMDEITARRRAIWDHYHQALTGLEKAAVLTRPVVPAEAQHNGHIYQVILADGIDRAGVIAAMAARGVKATSHYVPLHDAPAGRHYGKTVGPLPVTESVAGQLLRLPMHSNLSDGDLIRVIAALEAAI